MNHGDGLGDVGMVIDLDVAAVYRGLDVKAVVTPLRPLAGNVARQIFAPFDAFELGIAKQRIVKRHVKAKHEFYLAGKFRPHIRHMASRACNGHHF